MSIWKDPMQMFPPSKISHIQPHTPQQEEIIAEIEKLADRAREYQMSFVFGLQLTQDHNHLAINTPQDTGSSICSAILDLSLFG